MSQPKAASRAIGHFAATWNALDDGLKAVVAHVCATEANYALAEMERLNTEALVALTGQHKVQLKAFPADLIAAARATGRDVLGELGAKSAAAHKVHDSYVVFRERAGAWSRISLKAVLEAREE